MRRSLLAATLVALAAVLAGCSAISGSTSQAAPPPAATTSAAPATTAAHAARAAAKAAPDPSSACDRRPDASGDIFVRMLVPTLGWQAQRLGGGWVWNVTLRKCLTSVQMIIATAPPEAGNCTQVAYASSNPGYNPDGTPAKPLRKVIAQAGPGC